VAARWQDHQTAVSPNVDTWCNGDFVLNVYSRVKEEPVSTLAASDILKRLGQLAMLFLKTMSRVVPAVPWIFVKDPDTRTGTGSHPDVCIRPFHPPPSNYFFIFTGTGTAVL
jgi:hypothetical protein